MGIVFQDFRLINTMTVYDNVAFAMRVIGASQRDVRKRVPYILGLVGLQNKARSFRFSFRAANSSAWAWPGVGE